MIRRKIENIDDLKHVLSELNLKHDQTIVVRNPNYDFLGGIFYSEKFNQWVFYFDLYHVWIISSEDEMRGILYTFKQYPEIIFIPLKDRASLSYEMRYELIKDIPNALSHPKGNLADIIKETNENMFQPICFQGIEYGILVGCSTTMEDYYWVYLNPDEKLRFSSCVGGFSRLSENEIPDNLRNLMNKPDLIEIITNKKHEHFMGRDELCLT